jgi:hypothetical protein
MPDPVWDPDGSVRAALEEVVKEYGARALSSPSVLDNALPDLLPDSPRQVSLIIAASGSGVVGSLQERVAAGMDPDTAVRSAARQLAEQTPYDAAGCQWVTAEFARELGYQVSDDIAHQATPAPAPSPSAGPVIPSPPAPDQAVTVPPAGPAAAVTVPPAAAIEVTPAEAVAVTPAPPKRLGRRRTVIVLVVLVAGLLAGTGASGTWPFSSGPSVAALTQLLPTGTTQCVSKFNPVKANFVGMISKQFCQVKALNGIAVAFQFDNQSDYTASLNSFNRLWRFDPSGATSNCPASNGQQGETQWYSGSKGLYPRTRGQNLECFTSTIKGKSASQIFPIYVWTVPTENTFLQVIGSSNTSMSQLDSWWAKNGGPFNQ